MSTYRVIDVIGSSEKSWDDAAQEALRTAGTTLRDLRVAKVVKRDLALGEGGQVEAYRVRMQLSFKYEDFTAEAALAREIIGW